MENGTIEVYFNLTMFVNIGPYRYLAFVFCFLLYAFIVSANLVIILTISQERSLHEPMYIFVSCLSINSLYGSAGLFPRLLQDLLSDTHFITLISQKNRRLLNASQWSFTVTSSLLPHLIGPRGPHWLSAIGTNECCEFCWKHLKQKKKSWSSTVTNSRRVKKI
jgi:hypothetical protein